MTTHRITSVAGAVLAAAAFAAPAAAQNQDLRSPDARDAAAAAMSPSPSQDLRSPDARDAATRSVTPVVVRVSRPGDTGLAWDSAAIGALAGAGLLISLAGGGMLITRRRPSAVRPA
jgi:hypothetical protein